MEFIKCLLISSVLLNCYYIFEYLEYIPFEYVMSETAYELPYLIQRGGEINDNFHGKRRQIRLRRLRPKRMNHDNNSS